MINFPSSPTLNQTFTSGGNTWIWNGSAWVSYNILGVVLGGTGSGTAGGARTNLGGTTVGSNLFTLTNPSAVTFPRINADNTVSALDAATFKTAIGAGDGTVTSISGTGTVAGLSLSGTVTDSGNLTLGGTLSTTVSTINDSTTIGRNLVTLVNPSAVTFLRVNADNTVSTLDAATFRTAIGAGTSSTSGTVTSVGGTGTVSGLSLSGTVTSAGNLTLDGTLSVTPSNFASQTANTFIAAPNGTAGTPTFRSIVVADIPNLDAAKITSGTIDAARLPSYVDDVLEFANLAGFPATGETGKLYVALDTNKVYRWSGSVYIFITSGAVDSVAGKTGVVTLTKGDVGLANVDNTSDASKSVASAATLTTGRTIAITGDLSYTTPSFNGSTNVTAIGTLATVNTNVGSFTNASVTVNGKGLITAVSSGATPVTSVGGTSPVASSGGSTPTISLASGYGDTQNPYASKTAANFLAAPSGSSGVPSFRFIVAGDIPTLNQNTTGTAGNVTGTVAIANGGTGATTAPNARTGLGATTVGSNLFTLTNPSAVTFPRFNADNTVSTLDAATFRTAIGASSTTGTVTSVSGTGTVNGLSLSGTVTSSGNITLGGTLSGVSLTSQVSGTLPVSSGGTGVTSSTGTGSVVLSSSPTLVTPTLGAASATSIATGLGLVGTPAYTFTGDLNTGMWSPAADTVAVSTGGTERMRLDAAGNLGINAVPVAGYGNSLQLKQVGASATSALLHQSVGTNVQNLELLNNALPPAGGYTAGYNYTTTGEAATKYLSQAGNHIWFNAPTGTAGAAVTFSERMRIDTTGNVGIGTASPGYKLDVSATGNISGQFKTSGSINALFLADAGTTAETLYIGTVGNDFRVVTGSNERMRINSSGNVGIGTSAPGTKLEVSSTSAGATVEALRLNNPGGGANTAAQIKFFAAGTNYASIAGGYGAAAPQMTFNLPAGAGNYVWQNASTEQMRIDSAGNVGIGTASPGYKLSVAGTLEVTAAKEAVFTITDGAVNLDPNNGSIQLWTLGASRTPGQVNWAAGQSITLMIDDGTAFAITWSTLGVVWETNAGSAPTLATTGFTVIVLWKVGTTIYGARVGDA